MKKLKKILTLVLALVLVVGMTSLRASAQDVVQGQTVSVTFTFTDAYGVNGTINYSNLGMFESVPQVSTTGANMTATSSKFFVDNVTATTCTITLAFVVKDDASVGESCVITCDYVSYDATGDTRTTGQQSAVITVVESQNQGGSTQPSGPSNPPQGDTGTQVPDKEPETSAPKPVIDYSELKRQIEIAESLVQSEYTADSWKALAEKLAVARTLLTSDSQSKVDAGAKDLANAIKALVKIDYSKLLAAIDDAKRLKDSDKLGQLWSDLVSALNKGVSLLSSGDQASVDATAEEISKLIKAIQMQLDELNTPVIKEVQVEVPVAVEPTEDYCNIPIHGVWPILFWISLAFNALFIAGITLYIVHKKKNQKDDMPLVDYNIDDDE